MKPESQAHALPMLRLHLMPPTVSHTLCPVILMSRFHCFVFVGQALFPTSLSVRCLIVPMFVFFSTSMFTNCFRVSLFVCCFPASLFALSLLTLSLYLDALLQNCLRFICFRIVCSFCCFNIVCLLRCSRVVFMVSFRET